MNEEKSLWYPLFVIPLLVLAVFIPTLWNQFVWDDTILLLHNEAYRNFDLGRILLSEANGVEYLPVRDLSYALDYALWGERASGFHLTNTVLYGVNAWIIYLFIRQFLTSTGSPSLRRNAVFLAACLFIVHPLHSEAVSFITCRNVLLSGIFFFSTCYFYLLFISGASGKPKCYYGMALASAVLALFSKATAVTLPFVLVLLTVFAAKRKDWKVQLPVMPFLLLSLLTSVLFTSLAKKADIIRADLLDFTISGVTAKLATAIQIPFFYLQKLLLPFGLSPAYEPDFAPSLANPVVLVELAVLLLVLWLAIRYRNRWPLLSFGTGWYLVTLLPVLNIFQTNPVVADRYAYLPSFLLPCIAAVVLDRLAAFRGERVMIFSALLLISGWSVVTWRQNLTWRSEKTLWENAAAATPESLTAHVELGRILFREGNYSGAFRHFQEARRISPTDAHYDFFQGYLSFVRGDNGEAIRLFKLALIRNDQFLDALYHIAVSYERIGNRGGAIDSYRRVMLSRQRDNGGIKVMAAESLARLQGSR